MQNYPPFFIAALEKGRSLRVPVGRRVAPVGVPQPPASVQSSTGSAGFCFLTALLALGLVDGTSERKLLAEYKLGEASTMYCCNGSSMRRVLQDVLPQYRCGWYDFELADQVFRAKRLVPRNFESMRTIGLRRFLLGGVLMNGSYILISNEHCYALKVTFEGRELFDGEEWVVFNEENWEKKAWAFEDRSFWFQRRQSN